MPEPAADAPPLIGAGGGRRSHPRTLGARLTGGCPPGAVWGVTTATDTAPVRPARRQPVHLSAQGRVVEAGGRQSFIVPLARYRVCQLSASSIRCGVCLPTPLPAPRPERPRPACRCPWGWAPRPSPRCSSAVLLTGSDSGPRWVPTVGRPPRPGRPGVFQHCGPPPGEPRDQAGITGADEAADWSPRSRGDITDHPAMTGTIEVTPISRSRTPSPAHSTRPAAGNSEHSQSHRRQARLNGSSAEPRPSEQCAISSRSSAGAYGNSATHSACRAARAGVRLPGWVSGIHSRRTPSTLTDRDRPYPGSATRVTCSAPAIAARTSAASCPSVTMRGACEPAS
jgi:hypothetical protein